MTKLLALGHWPNHTHSKPLACLRTPAKLVIKSDGTSFYNPHDLQPCWEASITVISRGLPVSGRQTAQIRKIAQDNGKRVEGRKEGVLFVVVFFRKTLQVCGGKTALAHFQTFGANGVCLCEFAKNSIYFFFAPKSLHQMIIRLRGNLHEALKMIQLSQNVLRKRSGWVLHIDFFLGNFLQGWEMLGPKRFAKKATHTQTHTHEFSEAVPRTG